MSLELEIEKEFTHRSTRVKSLDFHPSQPWILASLHSGTVLILNYQSQIVDKSAEVTSYPVRSAKFITREQWLITGADDGKICVYNYNTMEKVKEFEAHNDYIRSLIVHSAHSYVLSSSDDGLIKLWDWNNDWTCSRIFEGHKHYVMQIAFNPKDPEAFASASLDGTIKTWTLSSPTPIATLNSNSKGVNCIEYFQDAQKPYLICGFDDFSAKVWDYENNCCVQILVGHENNVTSVCIHPKLPIIITGSEDKSVCIWHATANKLEKRLEYGLGRAWTVGYIKDRERLVIGYDEGIIILKMK